LAAAGRGGPDWCCAALSARHCSTHCSSSLLLLLLLLVFCQEEGLVPVGDVKLYQYHPPFTYGWQRVNEVLFEVREK
jgi:hypothetical protein